jgi:hypothetical protein
MKAIACAQASKGLVRVRRPDAPARARLLACKQPLNLRFGNAMMPALSSGCADLAGMDPPFER